MDWATDIGTTVNTATNTINGHHTYYYSSDIIHVTKNTILPEHVLIPGLQPDVLIQAESCYKQVLDKTQ